MTLTEFLLARIVEDESHLGYMRDHLADYTFPARPLADSYSRRVLAECEAKRRILARHGDEATESGCPPCWWEDADHCPTLRDLASVHADDPDFRQEWKP